MCFRFGISSILVIYLDIWSHWQLIWSHSQWIWSPIFHKSGHTDNLSGHNDINLVTLTIYLVTLTTNLVTLIIYLDTLTMHDTAWTLLSHSTEYTQCEFLPKFEILAYKVSLNLICRKIRFFVFCKYLKNEASEANFDLKNLPQTPLPRFCFFIK